jgi:hypothetical protein
VLPSHLTKETEMKKLITTAVATTLLLAAPLAALAGDNGHRRGGWGPQYSNGHGWKHGHAKHGYWHGAPQVYYPAPRVYYPAPRVVVPPPVYVPAPVVAIPAPAPYPYPSYPSSSVSIGFRLFF